MVRLLAGQCECHAYFVCLLFLLMKDLINHRSHFGSRYHTRADAVTQVFLHDRFPVKIGRMVAMCSASASNSYAVLHASS